MKVITEVRRDNLKALIEQCGSAAAFAKKIERSPSQVSQWVTAQPNSRTGVPRGIGSDTSRLIERVFGLAEGWMDVDHSDDVSNVVPIDDNFGTPVPLISFVQAGNWTEISDPYQPGVAEEWFPCPAKHGPRAYCLVVRGDSMSNPGNKPSYDQGDIIFVDPDHQPVSGDRVIVRLDDDKEATFKQYIEEGGQKYLKALNPEWKPRYIEVNEEADFCGVVIGKWVRE